MWHTFNRCRRRCRPTNNVPDRWTPKMIEISAVFQCPVKKIWLADPFCMVGGIIFENLSFWRLQNGRNLCGLPMSGKKNLVGGCYLNKSLIKSVCYLNKSLILSVSAPTIHPPTRTIHLHPWQNPAWRRPNLVALQVPQCSRPAHGKRCAVPSS